RRYDERKVVQTWNSEVRVARPVLSVTGYHVALAGRADRYVPQKQRPRRQWRPGIVTTQSEPTKVQPFNNSPVTTSETGTPGVMVPSWRLFAIAPLENCSRRSGVPSRVSVWQPHGGPVKGVAVSETTQRIAATEPPTQSAREIRTLPGTICVTSRP